jgi:FAD binding domain-containing protein
MTLIRVLLQTVGVMGWFTSGGHGPLSSDYGMGADNVLEATVLLPSGEIVTTNECQYPDLFFAIRGGGGSTYGAVLSATMRAHPTPQVHHHTFFMSSKTNDSSDFYEVSAFVLSKFPRLKEGGMQGYFGFRGGGTPGNRPITLNWGFYTYNKPTGTIEKLFAPIKERLDEEKDRVTYFSQISSSPTYFSQYRRASGGEPFATGTGWLGGWLIPEDALTDDLDKLAKALETAGPTFDKPAVCDLHSI